MVHLIATIRGQHRTIYHGTIVTVRDKTPGWGNRGRVKGRVYSLRTGSQTVLVRYRNSEYWYHVDDIRDVHMSKPIRTRYWGQSFRIFVGSHVRFALNGGGWSSVTTGEVIDIDFLNERVYIERPRWGPNRLVWEDIANVRSVMWEM